MDGLVSSAEVKAVDGRGLSIFFISPILRKKEKMRTVFAMQVCVCTVTQTCIMHKKAIIINADAEMR